MRAAVFAVLMSVAVPVFAYYITQSGTVTNEFTPADSVQPNVIETFDGDKTVKSDVKVHVGDTGYPVYVRAEILITWQDKNGIVYYTKPNAGTDYGLELNLTDWKLASDGFYYYQKSVESNGDTDVLIEKCEQKAEAAAPSGYSLSVEIITQTVQAIGRTDGDANGENTIDAVEDAWGVSLSG